MGPSVPNPRSFRLPAWSLLLVGGGDVAFRVLALLPNGAKVFALVRPGPQVERLRKAGVRVIVGDLDQGAGLRRIAGLADGVLYTAPPPGSGENDPRLERTLAALGRGMLPRCLVYISTSGVYGDHGGREVPETAALRAASGRGTRRLAAERALRDWGVRNQVATPILRAPGIYAAERLPLARLRAGTPAIRADEDSYSNHIHADDLARAALLALFRGRAGRAYNVCDDQPQRMGDWFDALADRFGLPRPPRLPREAVRSAVDPMLWSFMAESRRLRNDRLRRELRLRLRYPTVNALLDRNDLV